MRSSRSKKTEAELKKGVTSHRVNTRYSTLWPLLIILVTLMATTSRDLITFRSLKREIIRNNAAQQPLLERSGQEVIITNSLKDDLVKLSYSDAMAARILADYFPGSAPTKVSEPDTTGSEAPMTSPATPTGPGSPSLVDPASTVSTAPPPAAPAPAK